MGNSGNIFVKQGVPQELKTQVCGYTDGRLQWRSASNSGKICRIEESDMQTLTVVLIQVKYAVGGRRSWIIFCEIQPPAANPTSLFENPPEAPNTMSAYDAGVNFILG